MRIIFAGYLHGFGGAERAMIATANALSKDFNVDIINFTNEEVKYVIDDNVSIYNINYKNGKLVMLIESYKLLRVLKPDVVISFWLLPAMLLLLLKNVIGYKNIYAERGDPSDKEYNGLLGILRKIAFKYMDGFVFQTKAAMKYFNQNVKIKSVVIPNVVDVKGVKHIGSNGKNKIIIAAGRLEKQKNYALLIKAFTIVASKLNDVVLEIYGDGSLKETIEKLIIENNIYDRVILKPATKHIHNKMAEADIFVLTSDYEGMPNALLEAMAIGLPCISTNYSIGGVEEIIENNVNGLIVQCGDINNLANKMLFLLKNFEVAELFGINGMKKVAMYDKALYRKKWVAFLKKIR